MRFVKPEELDALIAENVRAWRARRRMRQEDLAADIGWTRPTVSSVEAGSRRITVADAVSLCRALQITFLQLLEGAPADVLNVLGMGPNEG
jgi:transcriptional regulator with XRE-family HTH domain